MDMKKMLAALDGVESAQGTTSSVAQKGSMKSLLESLDSVAAEEVVAEETKEVVEATDEEVEETTEEELEEAIMVSAEGDEAAELLAILQNAGMAAPAPAPAPMMPPMPEPEMDMQDEYSNSPDEQEMDLDAVIASGDDLHREKDQFPAAADGDNPMKAFEGKFQAILDEMLAEDNDETTEEELEEAQSPAQKAAFEKMLAAKKGNKADDKDEDDDDDEIEESVNEEKEECRYCGGDCPNDEHHACDGYLGDIDGLYEEAVAVNESADFSDMKHFMKRLNG